MLYSKSFFQKYFQYLTKFLSPYVLMSVDEIKMKVDECLTQAWALDPSPPCCSLNWKLQDLVGWGAEAQP